MKKKKLSFVLLTLVFTLVFAFRIRTTPLQSTLDRNVPASVLDTIKQANESDHSKPGKETLVVLLCNEKYCPATANLIASLRSDGGYTDDIAVIIDESINYTRESLEKDIVREGGRGEESKAMANIFLWTSEELFNSLKLSEGEGNAFLRETPPFSSCVAKNQTDAKIMVERKTRAYYLKSLMFHPIVINWKRVLYMDSCMTISSPHLHEIFSLPEAERQLLAQPDPWRWGKRGIVAKFEKECPDLENILDDGGTRNRTYEYNRDEATQLVKRLVGRNDLNNVRYFASGFILFDTYIIREHGESSATTVLGIMSLYQKLGRLFSGDQEILSIYWAYMRKQFRVLPLTTFESNRITYEFVKRISADPHIVTAGHKTRQVCTYRATNNLGRR